MRGPASPVFTARISEFVLHEDLPPRSTVLSGLELRLFLPGEPSVPEGALPLEHTLQEGDKDLYVHFRIKGIEKAAPQQLHRLCLFLLHVRDTLFDGLITHVKPGA